MGFKSAFKGLIKYHVIKAYGGVEVQLHVVLTSVLDCGQLYRPVALPSWKKALVFTE
jgi:hypothetical protein